MDRTADTAGKIETTTARPVHAPCAPCARAPGSSSASDDVFFWLGDFAELRKLAKTPPEKRGTRVASLTGSQRPARAAATYNSWRQRFERSAPRKLAERTRWRGATERSVTLRLSERCAAPLASGAAGSAHGPADQHGQYCRAMPPRRCRGSASAVSASLRPRIGATRMPLCAAVHSRERARSALPLCTASVPAPESTADACARRRSR